MSTVPNDTRPEEFNEKMELKNGEEIRTPMSGKFHRCSSTLCLNISCICTAYFMYMYSRFRHKNSAHSLQPTTLNSTYVEKPSLWYRYSSATQCFDECLSHMTNVVDIFRGVRGDQTQCFCSPLIETRSFKRIQPFLPRHLMVGTDWDAWKIFKTFQN